MHNVKKKDPNDKDTFGINWSTYLDGDTIDSSSWAAPKPVTDPALEIVTGSEANTTSTTAVDLKGGVEGNEYIVANQITTTSGSIAERSLRLLVVEL